MRWPDNTSQQSDSERIDTDRLFPVGGEPR